jgi:8-hydroxy-5-deazaflavin:NADPH oxidoreductase
MRIGFIGSGNIGGTVARLLAERGHEVWLSNSRGPDTLRDLAAQIGERAHPATGEEAAEVAEVVVVSIPFGRIHDLPAKPLAGKIVIDTNNYYPRRDGQWAELDSGDTTSSELLAGRLPGARVVKAFNTIYYAELASQGQPAGTPDRRALPIAGDDPAAKAVVAGLLDEIGYDAVDAGPLRAGRRFEPDTPPYGPRLDAAGLRDALAASGTP